MKFSIALLICPSLHVYGISQCGNYADSRQCRKNVGGAALPPCPRSGLGRPRGGGSRSKASIRSDDEPLSARKSRPAQVGDRGKEEAQQGKDRCQRFRLKSSRRECENQTDENCQGRVQSQAEHNPLLCILIGIAGEKYHCQQISGDQDHQDQPRYCRIASTGVRRQMNKYQRENW
jgi:hypothetical protein